MSRILAFLLMLQAAPPAGSVSGTVILAGSASQSPLALARVELSGGPVRSLVVRTDGLGRFAFANLPPGAYKLRVTKDGFIRQENAKRAPIVIRPGESHKPVVFALEVAPTMAGRIQNENGEPVANILVQAMKGVYGSDGKRTFTELASTLSDDLGDYRLYWLDPGEYVVSASYVPVAKTSVNPIQAVPRVVYAQTYYPNANALIGARRIVLKADQNNLTLDFRLIRAPLVTVRGSTTESNHPLSTNVTLRMAGDAAGTPRYSAKSSDLGAFVIENVAPGSYIATAETLLGNTRIQASKHIVVYDRDENNVGLVLNAGVPIAGRVALDTGAPVNLGAARPAMNSVDQYLDSFAGPTFQSDGQFVINSVQPGEYTFDISALPEDLYIKSERSGQTNLIGVTLGIGAGSPAPFEIQLGTDGGHIDGTVADSAGKPFAGAQVVLVPKGIRSNYRVSNSDEDGMFVLRGIPPGDYQLFAWEDVEDRAWLNSEFMASYGDAGTAVTIVPNARGTIQLPLIPEKR
jgi:Carboxypeptidase regulatory-like domain